MFSTDVAFNNNNLNGVTGVTIYNYDSLSLPNRQLRINKLAKNHLSILTSADYSDKLVRVYGRLCGNTKEESDEILDNLKALLLQPNKALVVDHADTTVQWTATLEDIEQEWFGKQLNFILMFRCTTPFSSDSNATTLMDLSAQTAATTTSAISVSGSARATPLFIYTLNSVTDGTAATLTISNAETGQGIAVTRDWIADDIIEIDSDSKEVDVNGIRVDFTGSFPEFYPGSRSVDIVDTFTARNFDILVTYYKKRT